MQQLRGFRRARHASASRTFPANPPCGFLFRLQTAFFCCCFAERHPVPPFLPPQQPSGCCHPAEPPLQLQGILREITGFQWEQGRKTASPPAPAPEKTAQNLFCFLPPAITYSFQICTFVQNENTIIITLLSSLKCIFTLGIVPGFHALLPPPAGKIRRHLRVPSFRPGPSAETGRAASLWEAAPEFSFNFSLTWR